MLVPQIIGVPCLPDKDALIHIDTHNLHRVQIRAVAERAARIAAVKLP